MKDMTSAGFSGAGCFPERPPITIPSKIDVPCPECMTLANGIEVYTINFPQTEVFRMSFVFRAGTSLQPLPFSASTTANLLSEGTELHNAQQIAEHLDFYGSYYDVTVDRDYVVVSFVCLSKFFDHTLDIAREILLMPSFPDDELAIYCGKRKQKLALDRQKVGHKVRELFARALFGQGHPYGVSYPETMYDDIARDDIAGFYRSRYTAANCFVVCSGRVDPHVRDRIASLAAEIPAGGDGSLPAMPEPQSVKSAIESHKGAVQSAVRIGRVLFPRMHPDYIPMQVAATVLGGYFGSRLVRNLREERGYTYGVFAGMVNFEYAGYFAVATEVAAGATADAAKQIFREIERLHNEPVGERELQMVRNIMTGEVMRILDGPFGIADVAIENIQNRTDNGYLDRFLEEVRTITPEKIRDTAVKYLDKDSLTMAVVGDPAFAGKLGK